MASTVKKLIRSIVRNFGYDISYIGRESGNYPGGAGRPVGRMDTLLQDMKVRGLQCKTIVDVGANTGHWSRIAKSVFPDAKSILIEPLNETGSQLEKFVSDFPGSKIFPYGAAATPGRLTFTVWDDLQGSSFIPEEKIDLVKSGKQRSVEVITIDDLIAKGEFDVPELMKLDVQGFELEALKGASSTFGRTEVYILEVSLFHFDPKIPVFFEIIKFMEDRQYSVYDFPGFLRRPYDGALGQCDICFVKNKGMFRNSDAWD
jgi:FkbM family methyltransferase